MDFKIKIIKIKIKIKLVKIKAKVEMLVKNKIMNIMRNPRKIRKIKIKVYKIRI